MKMKFKCWVYILCALVIAFVFLMWSTLLIPSLQSPIEKDLNVKYVLQWTSASREPFVYMGQRQEVFINHQCTVTNCYITSNRYLLNDITDFDAILFDGAVIAYKSLYYMPRKRSSNQKYIFVNMESSVNYPVKDDRYNDFFNLTWTYKLSSDIYYGYIIVRDKYGDVIGPAVDIPWMNIDDMAPINQTIEEKLAHKKLAATWFVSNCNAPSNRSQFVQEVIKELNKYGLTVDIYGKCGTKECPRNSMRQCLDMIARDYYFYFAFENSFCEDYVTEKLAYALQNYAVPVVFGGANYSRFMPDGIYLDAVKLGVLELATQMVNIIADKSKYYNFFKWHNYYSYQRPEETSDTNYYCKFCEYLNSEEFVKRRRVVNDFKSWWKP